MTHKNENIVLCKNYINIFYINTIMGNSSNQYHIRYFVLYDHEIQHIRTNYKVVDVDWLESIQVNSKIFNDDYFLKSPQKKEIINNMTDFFINDKDKAIYKKTDYLCNEKEKLCICNTNAEKFRQIYDRINYKENKKYISWCEKIN